MNDRHILAEIERSLTRDDPELAARMTRLSRALDTPADNPAHHTTRCSARRDAVIPIMIMVMFVATLAALLAVNAVQPSATTPQPTGSAAPISEPAPSP